MSKVFGNEIRMVIADRTCGEERAFYGTCDTVFSNCIIDGAEDGESAFKECRRIDLEGCRMALRYPIWHVDGCKVTNCRFEDTCRAPLWYCDRISIYGSEILGVKAVRECGKVEMVDCTVVSAEFGWKTRGFTALNTDITAEYLFLDSSDIYLENVTVKGKYTFQYVKNAVIKNCVLDTKDAFWHAENVTVYDSVVTGEYLGWYSKGLRLVRCRISGTQPLCYALVSCCLLRN